LELGSRLRRLDHHRRHARPEQLDESLRATSVKLSAEVLAKVDEITREILYPMG